MEILEIKNVSYSYANSKEKVLSGVNQKFEFSLKDIIHSELEFQFEREIIECIRNKTFSFDFPIETGSNLISNLFCTENMLKTNFNGLLYGFSWYKIITLWLSIFLFSMIEAAQNFDSGCA